MNNEKKKKVWIINRSAHDFSDAQRFGELHFLSDGPIIKTNVADMDRQFTARLEASEPEDYILPTSLSVMTAIACSIFVLKHHCLNLLLYKNGMYIERKLCYATPPQHQNRG